MHLFQAGFRAKVRYHCDEKRFTVRVERARPWMIADQLSSGWQEGIGYMRGKWLVVGLLLATVVFAIYGLWYFGTSSAPDDRFNLNRQPIPADANQALFFPNPPSGFTRASLQPMAADNTGRASGSAVYNSNDHPVELLVRSIQGLDPQRVLNSSDQLDACTHTASNITVHPDAKTPYRYSTCPGNQFEFTWINGNWLLRASSEDVEALLRFVNAYPF
jgi:hypothetical protein